MSLPFTCFHKSDEDWILISLPVSFTKVIVTIFWVEFISTTVGDIVTANKGDEKSMKVRKARIFDLKFFIF